MGLLLKLHICIDLQELIHKVEFSIKNIPMLCKFQVKWHDYWLSFIIMQTFCEIVLFGILIEL